MTQDIVSRNNVIIKGKGDKTIVFAHGFGCDQNMWRFVTPAFEDDYKIVLFDYVGCGKSDISAYNVERYSNLEGYAQDVLDVCKALEIEDAIFVGHSVSAMIGALAAIEQPHIFSSMIFIGPSARYINDVDYLGGFSQEDLEGLLDVMDSNYIGWANFLAPVVMKNDDRPELTKELEESFCSTDPVITRKFAEVTFFSDNREDISNLQLPCLVLQCSDDAIAPDEVGIYVHQQIKGSTYQKMEATGHCPHMSHPQETIELIQEFLNQQPH
ncbi:alpha/beta hydrolase [uncultured Gelidibacter sp.]|uniref:alpha/beta fold hydrolase n=1 Tax=uncultured Gelidibacter sp. TaxID=259318 RepID=UPI002614C27A|nr:alpha/beta hydrolase [uncultured Gelidibacter sp.]